MSSFWIVPGLIRLPLPCPPVRWQCSPVYYKNWRSSHRSCNDACSLFFTFFYFFFLSALQVLPQKSAKKRAANFKLKHAELPGARFFSTSNMQPTWRWAWCVPGTRFHSAERTMQDAERHCVAQTNAYVALNLAQIGSHNPAARIFCHQNSEGENTELLAVSCLIEGCSSTKKKKNTTKI